MVLQPLGEESKNKHIIFVWEFWLQYQEQPLGRLFVQLDTCVSKIQLI